MLETTPTDYRAMKKHQRIRERSGRGRNHGGAAQPPLQSGCSVGDEAHVLSST
jgi:hypothetical protein